MSKMTFSSDTDPVLQEVLTNLRASRERVRIFYGNKETGEVWNEEHGVLGYIGATTGIHSPILLYNNHSMGGGLLLTDCILKIIDMSHRTRYIWEKFIQPKVEVIDHLVLINDLVYAQCKDHTTAVKLSQFMAGERFTK